MDVLIKFASKYNFERLYSKLDRPIVFHCVPGAGKSSCIREILAFDSRFAAFTLGIEDPPSLTNNRIKKYSGELSDDFLNILDEYTLEGVDTRGFIAVFGDPIQSAEDYSLRAHFVCRTSLRFGKCTAQLLCELGYEVKASGEDVIQIAGLYEIDPKDNIIFYEEEVGCLLRRHCLEAYHIKELVGPTFDRVTFVTSHSKIPREARATVFQCLTRHRRSLLIMCPNGSYTSS
ncbi:triple gene block protein 1 [Stevia carlavirus 1]|uniref:Triple gene block protein 1 n=1 Tax=Stevia carlavirus 1 TaxID=2794421 RepID=A0AAE9T8T5_9VIRU|nr:triple gene block protein 1 [Stevia carlavirus 1]